MLQTVLDPAFQTMVVMVLLILGLIVSLRTRREGLGFTPLVTNEMKGVAILMVIFGHIGYFLFSDHSFLFPISTVSGIGVDIFFLLSGFGLALSALGKRLTPWEFYRRRLDKVFVPLWGSLVLLLIADALLLGRFFDWGVVLRSFLGIFPSADIYQDLNSPLWYLTPLLFYYLLFPWVFRREWGVWSALVLGAIAWMVLQLPIPVTDSVKNLYMMHFLAFPVGVVMGTMSLRGMELGRWVQRRVKSPMMQSMLRYLLMMLALGVFLLTYNLAGNFWLMQIVSILDALLILLVLILSKLHFHLLGLLGAFSYEIYLLHWPLLYHYDVIYRYVPAGLGTMLYLAWFLLLAWLLRLVLSGVKGELKSGYKSG